MSSGTTELPAPPVPVTQQDRAEAPEARRTGPVRDVVLPGAILALTTALVLVSFWPGHMSNDTLTQIESARGDFYSNHHAPVLVWLWSLVYQWGFGPGWATGVQVILFVAGAFLLLRTVFRPLGAAIGTALICLAPNVIGMLGYLSRDTLFTSLLLASFGAVAEGSRHTGRARTAWLGGAIVLSWLTITTRQNAAAASIIGLVIVMALLLPLRGGRIKQLALATGAGLLVTLAMLAGNSAITKAIGTADVDPEQYLYVYDVAAMSMQEHENLFPASVMKARDFETVRSHWNIDSMLAYQFIEGAPIKTVLDHKQTAALGDAWKDAVKDHPVDYLDERVDLMARQLGMTRAAMWIYHPAIDPNNLGFHVVFPGPNGVAKDYVEAFVPDPRTLDGGIIHRPWPYLLLGIVAAIALLRRGRSWPLLVVGGLGLASLTYQSGLFLGAMGTQYRFEFPTIVIGLLAIAVLGRLAWDRRAGTRTA